MRLNTLPIFWRVCNKKKRWKHFSVFTCSFWSRTTYRVFKVFKLLNGPFSCQSALCVAASHALAFVPVVRTPNLPSYNFMAYHCHSKYHWVYCYWCVRYGILIITFVFRDTVHSAFAPPSRKFILSLALSTPLSCLIICSGILCRPTATLLGTLSCAFFFSVRIYTFLALTLLCYCIMMSAYLFFLITNDVTHVPQHVRIFEGVFVPYKR